MSNSFGVLYRITTFGESHGEGVGVVIDGCPAGIQLDLNAIQYELNRRRPGQSRITTQRKESDEFQLLSGHVNAKTTGAPLCFWVKNRNARSRDYDHIATKFRPSHADYTYFAKYGTRDYRGGGRASARETVARVIGGAVAKQLLAQHFPMQIRAWVHSIHQLKMRNMPQNHNLHTPYMEAVKCPDEELAEAMFRLIDRVRKEGNSVGGTIMCQIEGVPAGWGEPIYDKLHAKLGYAMLGINAVKAFELGSGFQGTEMMGAEHNDIFYQEEGRIRTHTNHSGGIQGGITNGEAIYFRVGFKPTSTLMRDQPSVDTEGNAVIVKGKGRHDPCVVPRAVPIVEAMAAICLADAWLLHKARKL